MGVCQKHNNKIPWSFELSFFVLENSIRQQRKDGRGKKQRSILKKR